MIILYVIYALLIVTVIVVLPLRLRERRRTFKEIESLRLSFKQDIRELIERLEPRTRSETTRRKHSLGAYLAEEDMTKLWRFYSKLQCGKSKDVVLVAKHFEVSPYTYNIRICMKEYLTGSREIYERLGKQEVAIVSAYTGAPEEVEDVWAIARECQRRSRLIPMEHAKLAARP